MTKIFEYFLVVPQSAIDENGHANNIEYVRWMQEAAVAHSSERGWSNERYNNLGAAWVARSHHIEYLKPAFLGDQLVVQTWVADFHRLRSKRRYRILQVSDGTVLAKAETEWVFIDRSNGRPCSVPKELAESFIIVPPEDEPK